METTPEEYSYRDFAMWQQTLLADDADEGATAYWADRLSGAPVGVNLPTDKVGRGEQSFRKCSLQFDLSDDLTLRLLALSAEYNVALRDTFYAAFAALVVLLMNRSPKVVPETPSL